MSNDRYQKIRDALAGVAERESLRQRAAAWDAVADTLGEVCPEWINHPGTGTEAAVAAIRKLAQQPEARVGGEPVGWVFQHEETGRMTFCENDGINTPEKFAELNPRFALCSAAYTTPPPSAVPADQGGEAVAIPADSVDGELSVEQAINELCEMHPGADRLAMKLLAALFTHKTVVRYRATPAPQQPEARVGGEVSYAECCDTPAYCSSVRRCTAKDTPPPSAEQPYEIDALFDALSNLEHDNYERSYSGSKNREADAGLIRAALERYVAPVATHQQPEARTPEVLGERCIDGGKCHHGCTERCFRRECCSPFSGYTGPWAYQPEPGEG